MKKGPEETNSPVESCPSKTDARTFYKNERSQWCRYFHQENTGKDQLSGGELLLEHHVRGFLGIPFFKELWYRKG